MPGKQASFAVAGAQNEVVAEDLIGRLAAPVRVPRQHDFGVDFYCQLYMPNETRSVSVTEVFTLQVKGQSEGLQFGGAQNGEWRDYEVAWLRTLATPHFLARVDAAEPAVELYCLGQIWRVLWQTPAPYEITCTTEAATSQMYQRLDVHYETLEETLGDMRRWNAPIGPPFLRLTHADLSNPTRREQARRLLAFLIRVERANLLRFQQRVAVHKGLETWSTNLSSQYILLSEAMFWSSVPGDNLRELGEALTPGVVNLGAHLQWQNDKDAYRLIPILRWLETRGVLDPMGKGLLEGLMTAEARGEGPAAILNNRK